MSESIIDSLGISQEDMDQAQSSAIAKVFEPLPSAAMDAEVEDITVYTNQWGGKQMRYNVIVKDDKGESRILTFRSDIGKKLKDGSANHGYAGRLEQFAYATNTPMAELSLGQAVKIKVFGKETDANLLVGMKGKKVKALVRLTDDINKEEGQSFKYSNDIQGVVAMNGTEKSGENAVTPFEEAIAKKAIYEVKGKAKKAKPTGDAVVTASGKSVEDLL